MPMPPSAMPPSGDQIELHRGNQAATVVTVSGGVRSYQVDGRDVLDGYAEDAMCDGARGQLLLPWPNRVKDGEWQWDGKDRQLAITEPEQHNAIHGLSRWSVWQVTKRDDASAELAITIPPQPGWDWPLRAVARHELTDGGLRVTTMLTNLGTSPAPVAAGAHPYLTAGTTRVDECSLTIPASTRLPTGEQQIPTGTEPVQGTEYDFRESRQIGELAIDFAFTDLLRDADGMARVRLVAPSGQWAALWVDQAFGWVEIFTGDALPDASRRREGLGVEPMSAPPNALATGEGLVTLSPGDTWSGSWGIESSLLD